MRIAALSDRAVMVDGSTAIDIETASRGRFGPAIQGLYPDWDDFIEWASDSATWAQTEPTQFDLRQLGPPSPSPRQVFAIGLNYQEHASEAGVKDMPDLSVPPTFTKFAASLTGPYGEVRLPSSRVDWEVELVVVIGSYSERVEAHSAWAHVAGLTVGQDFSERDIQRLGPVPQFSMAKSYPGFGPTGPWLVTTDELEDRDDLELECVVNGEIRQRSRTSAMIVPVSELIAQLSAICPLYPGDVIFSGTPSGVGMGRTPELYLKPGDEVISRIRGIGEIRQMCVS
jgi:2,4-diketo-3-deoxy-L-fuconate hydrolase